MKGEFGQECNRRVCQNKPAIWFNLSTRKYYCPDCAERINFENRNDQFVKKHGGFLCVEDTKGVLK